LTALADNLVEGDEYATVTITAEADTHRQPYVASSHITDDPPVIAVEASDTAEASATGGFSFTRTGATFPRRWP